MDTRQLEEIERRIKIWIKIIGKVLYILGVVFLVIYFIVNILNGCIETVS